MNNQDLIKKWYNLELTTEKEKVMLNNFSVEELNDAFDSSKLQFGTAGIRQKMGPGTNRMNAYVYRSLSEGYAKFILKNNNINPVVVICHDNRENSEFFSQICAEVLASKKITVFLNKDNELLPTPIASYAMKKMKADGGIIITASHNTKEYNGFKVYNSNAAQVKESESTIIKKMIPKIEDILSNSYDYENKYIKFFGKEMCESYFDDLFKFNSRNKEFLKEEKKEPIVFTGHHGTTCELMPLFLKKMNYKNINVVKKQNFFDSSFVNSPIPNPEDASTFKLSEELAKEIGAKIMFACDPDGDRMALAVLNESNEWTYMTGNQMGIIYTHYILSNGYAKSNPYLVASYVSTYYIDKIAKKYNCEVIRCGTGFKYMGNIVSEQDKSKELVVAFEEAIGALTCEINADKDGFGAIMLALEVHESIKKTYGNLYTYYLSILKEYGTYFSITNSTVIESLDWKSDAERMLKILTEWNCGKLLDYYTIKKVSFNENGGCLEWQLDNESFIKFRLSGTEPKFKMYFELLNKPQENYNTIYKEITQHIKLKLGV